MALPRLRGWTTLLLVAAHVAAATPLQATADVHEPCRDHDPLRQPFFGDLHVHTALSLDASTQGTRNMPRDAYRFARGDPLGIQPYDADGRPLRHLQLSRPLDFAAVTDHAELFGEQVICESPGLPGWSSPMCFIYRRWPRLAFFLMNHRSSADLSGRRYELCGADGRACLQAAHGPWQIIQDAAEEFYDRSAACTFTTFVGYEWTGTPGANNLHRNLIFRGTAVPRLPITHFEATDAEELNRRLLRECVGGLPECDVLSIPHNSNLSGGLMFQTTRADGAPMTAEDARVRASMEPLVEVMQHKGDSECLLGGETTDEACGFEKLPYGNFAGRYVRAAGVPVTPSSFVRPALKEGLAVEERTGVNPFKYGLVASSDTHLGAPGAVDEKGYPGHGGAGIPAMGEIPLGLPDDIEFNPGGLAVLWAEENTRESLFAAMRRREAYGTSGPRITVRFFAGWNLPPDLCEGDFVRRGYAHGVPMGADLPPQPSPAAAPSLAVWALRDAAGAPLQGVQIVKGWLEGEEVRERVYDVAGSQAPPAAAPAGCGVAMLGPDELCRVWTDPDFDPGERAFYYARVLQTPTCRWSTYLCRSAAVDCTDARTIRPGFEGCCDPAYPRMIQERAWTSPIWTSPAA